MLLDSSSEAQNFDLCPSYSPFFGTFGIALAMCLTNLGSAYGIAKSSLGISSLGVMKPEVVMKGILPVIFAGIIPIYGIIISIMVVSSSLFSPFRKQTLFLCVCVLRVFTAFCVCVCLCCWNVNSQASLHSSC